MPNERTLQAAVGLQAAHGTAVAPTIIYPGTTDYEDTRELHESTYDAGTWWPTVIVNETLQATKLMTKGDGFHEIMPIYFNSGLNDVEPTTTYQYEYSCTAAAVGTPKPTTWLVGAIGTDIGGTGPCVKLKDMYLSKLTLTGNMGSKIITHSGEWFGSTYDDNSGAGYVMLGGVYAVTGCAYATKVVTLKAVNTLKVGDSITVAGINAGFTVTNIDGTWTCKTGTNATDVVFDVTSQPSGTTPQTITVGTVTANLAVPASLDLMRFLKAALTSQDAPTTGGSFTTMDNEFLCTLLDWTWELTTGWEPSYCGNVSTVTMGAVQMKAPPTCTFQAAIRLSTANYAIVKAKHVARTPQELQLIISGTGSNALTLQMTGRWAEVPTAHARSDGEVVMNAKFVCESPPTQIITPHFLTVTSYSSHNWLTSS